MFWNAMGPGSVAYTITELFDNLPEAKVDRTLWCLSRDEKSPRAYQTAAIPKLLYRALCKAGVPMPAQGRLASNVALRSIQPGDIVYVWPPYDLRLIKRAQTRGAIVVGERINCMGAMCRDVLSRAFARRGLPMPEELWRPEDIAEERDQMLQCDFLTAPNSLVLQSLREADVPEDRILETSYGYSAKRLASAIGIERPARQPVFAFVGVGDVRKGLDVLLEAWERAGLNATLLIAGRIDPEIGASYRHVLERPDVKALGFVDDIAAVYAAADVFVFPSHEEGGPQVTYEAAACGLPSIVSPMGAGRVVRDRVEGLIVDPLDVDDLARALTLLANDVGLRRQLGFQAAERAREFEWPKVGARLYQHFRNIADRAN
jgi:glycosyltransferase involved in cell wall biosynthesis